MTEDQLKFWSLVLNCLMQFHEMSEIDALMAISNFQNSLHEHGSEVEEIVYHDDPFNLAYDLSGKSIGREYHEFHEQHIAQYREMCGGTFW